MNSGTHVEGRDLSESANAVANFAHALAGLYIWEAIQSFLVDLELVVTLYLRYCPIVRCIRYLRATVNARRVPACPQDPPESSTSHATGFGSLGISLDTTYTTPRKNDVSINEALSSSSKLHCFANLAGYDAYVLVRLLSAFLVLGIIAIIDNPSTSSFVTNWITQDVPDMSCRTRLIIRVIFWAMYGATLAFASLLLSVRAIALYIPDVESHTSKGREPIEHLNSSKRNTVASTPQSRLASAILVVVVGSLHGVQWILLVVCVKRLASNPPELRAHLTPEDVVTPCAFHVKLMPADNIFQRRSELLVVFVYFMAVNFLLCCVIFLFCFKSSKNACISSALPREAGSFPFPASGMDMTSHLHSLQSSRELSQDCDASTGNFKMARLEPRRRPGESVHFAINHTRTAEVNGRDLDLEDPSKPSTSRAGPSHNRFVVTKPSKLALSFVADSESTRSCVEETNGSHEGSIAHIENGPEELDPSLGNWEPNSKGKGKARADQTTDIVASDVVHVRGSRLSDGDGVASRSERPLHNISVISSVCNGPPSRSDLLLRELRAQGFGFMALILLGNVAVVVCLICRTSSSRGGVNSSDSAEFFLVMASWAVKVVVTSVASGRLFLYVTARCTSSSGFMVQFPNTRQPGTMGIRGHRGISDGGQCGGGVNVDIEMSSLPSFVDHLKYARRRRKEKEARRSNEMDVKTRKSGSDRGSSKGRK